MFARSHVSRHAVLMDPWRRPSSSPNTNASGGRGSPAGSFLRAVQDRPEPAGDGHPPRLFAFVLPAGRNRSRPDLMPLQRQQLAAPQPVSSAATMIAEQGIAAHGRPRLSMPGRTPPGA